MPHIHKALFGITAGAMILAACRGLSGVDDLAYEPGPSGSGGGGGDASSATTATTTGSSSGSAGTSGSGGASSTASSGGGGAGGSVSSTCPPGGIGQVIDDFNDNITGPQWLKYENGAGQVSVKEMNGGVTITTTGAANLFGGYYSQPKARPFAGCSVHAEVTGITDTTEPFTVFLAVTSDNIGVANNLLSIGTQKGDLRFTYLANGMLLSSHIIAYDAVLHRWWRHREAGGVTYFETAPDGVTWTVRHTVATPSFADSMWVYFGAGTVQAAAGGGEATFDNLNVLP
jgi:hypothetical protein